MQRVLRRFFSVLAALVVGFILLGYGGAIHAGGDSLGVFRAYAALGLILIGVAMAATSARRRSLAAILFGGVVFATLGILPFGRGAQIEASNASTYVYHNYQKNLLFKNSDQNALLSDILSRNPDTVTVQETNLRNQTIYRGLEAGFASHVHCEPQGVAVYSRWEMVPGSGQCDWGLAAMQVVGPEGPLWVISTHLRWVYPYRNAQQVAELAPTLAALKGAKIIGGDFNTVPWTHSFRAFARAADVDRIGRTPITIIKANGALRVPIDHVLATGGKGQVEVLPRLGSDHFGLWAAFSMEALAER